METQTGRTSSDSGIAAPSLTDIQLCNAGRPAVIARPLTRPELIAILVTMVATSTPASINLLAHARALPYSIMVTVLINSARFPNM